MAPSTATHFLVDGGPSDAIATLHNSRDNVQQERRGTHLGRRKRCEHHDSEKGRPASLSGRGVKQRNAADNAGDGKHVFVPRCLLVDAAIRASRKGLPTNSASVRYGRTEGSSKWDDLSPK